MALRIRFQYPTGAKLGLSIERLTDGTFLDGTDGRFKPRDQVKQVVFLGLPEDTGDFKGRYARTIDPTPDDVFTDGHYAVTVHDLDRSNEVLAELATTMRGGDDAPARPITVDDLARFQDGVTAVADQMAAGLAEVKRLAAFRSHA